MSNERALAPTQNGGIGIWNGEEVALLKEVIAKGATDAELLLFSKVCERRQLDPFARQIYCIKRDGKVTFQTGIDGFRSIADRTKAYAGNDEYRFDEGLTEYQHIKAQRGNPDTATATVYKIVGGVRCGFSATARWDEYYPGERQGFMWKKMPYTMLGKVAESQALRRAFPEQLGGIYTDEEMAQADKANAVEAEWSTGTHAQAPTSLAHGDDHLSEEQAKQLQRFVRDRGYSGDDMRWWMAHIGKQRWSELTEAEGKRMAQDAEDGVRPWQPEPPAEAEPGALIGDDFDAESEAS